MVRAFNFGVCFHSKEVFIVMFTYSIHVQFQVGLMEAVKQEISCQQDEEELPTKSSCCIHGVVTSRFLQFRFSEVTEFYNYLQAIFSTSC